VPISKNPRRAADETSGDRDVIAESMRISSAGGLYARMWSPMDRSARGIAILVHGLGDHSGHYESFARRMVNRHWSVFAIDLPGHGRSPGRRGASPSYNRLLAMIALARAALAHRLAGVPQVLIGHSMGGNLAINYVLRRAEFDAAEVSPLDGLVLLAPMLMPPQVFNRPRVFAAWGTGQLLRWVRVSRPANPDKLTRCPTAARRIASDPLRHEQISVYLATQLLAQGRFALDRAAEVTTRTLVVYGTEDRLIDRAACRNLALRMRGHADLLSWNGGRHDLVNDVDADLVADRLTAWLDRGLPQLAQPIPVPQSIPRAARAAA